MKRAFKCRAVPLHKIVAHIDIQSRVQMDEATIADYCERMEAGDHFPPGVVFADPGDAGCYWLADGFHRFEAARRAGKKSIVAEVHTGGRDDAAWWALGANKKNGLRMTREDKRRCVLLALAMKPKMSDRGIAEYVGVGHPLVAAIRRGDPTEQIPANHGNSALAQNTENRTGASASVGDVEDLPLVSQGKQSPLAPHWLDVEPPPEDEEVEPLPPPPAPRVLDATGVVVPTHLNRIFLRAIDAQELDHLAHDVVRIKHAVLSAQEKDDPLYRAISPGSWESECNRVRAALLAAKPYAACRSCAGAGCVHCSNRGWITELEFGCATPPNPQE